MARRKWNYETIQQVMDGENPFIQVGYTPKVKKRKLGDKWQDKNKVTWEQCNGYKKRVNEKADSIRDMLKQKCSECGRDLSFSDSVLDRKIFPKTGKCYDCVEAEESIMRMTGKYKEYEEKKIMANKLSYLREFRQNVVESIDYLKKDNSEMSIVSSRGDLVTWTGSQNKELLKNAEADLVEVDKLIAEVEQAVLV
jgi:hypothetical protein